MVTHDPRIDAYIRKAAPFARPILIHLRAIVHSACPSVVETVNWGHPSFEFEGILCGMAAFKAHCAFGFWKHELVVDGDTKAKEAMGSFGRITCLQDVPAKAVLARYVKKAMKLNAEGVQVVRGKTTPRRAVPMHPDLRAALAKNKRALRGFETLRPSHQREYLEWIAGAKRPETRARRIASAVEWIAEGKPQNWKYTAC